jgi:taurine dioxygenase
MSIELRQIDGQFAFEAIGTPIWSQFDHETARTLERTLSRHGVLIFRRQSLSEKELVNFSNLFGTAEKIVRADWASADHAEITHISNMRNAAGDPIGGLGSGELEWHTDQSYMTSPATGAILYGVEVPLGGPDTMWANLALAYDALPGVLQKNIAGRRGIFSYAKRVSAYDQETTPEEVRRKTPDVYHPLVNTHPETSQKSLYLDPATTVGIEGMPEDEGISLLQELATHAASPVFVYQHVWQPGDIVMWNNGFLLHRRDAFAANQNRLLKRTTIRLSKKHHILPGS